MNAWNKDPGPFHRRIRSIELKKIHVDTSTEISVSIDSILFSVVYICAKVLHLMITHMFDES